MPVFNSLPKIGALIVDHKLIDVYQDRIEAIK